MASQPKYIMQPDLDKALSAFTGYIDHTISMAKADIRRELIESEDRLRGEIHASEGRVQAEINEVKERVTRVEERLTHVEEQLTRVETIGKDNHQMMQIMLQEFSKVTTQLSKINKKLGID